MRATKTRTLDRPTTPEQLFDAALGVVQHGKYTMLLLDTELRRIGFVSGKTAISWGQEYLVEVVPAADGAILTVVCGSHDDAPKALMDGWKGGKAADKYLAAVESVLDGSTTAPVTPTASFVQGEGGDQ
jgi:hypothetical protein